ncbi:MAG: hypothetical protein AABX65_02190 [Nanoarchaeota archaeon]|mgnify:CR=1 FL=1
MLKKRGYINVSLAEFFFVNIYIGDKRKNIMDYIKICFRRTRPFPIIKHTFFEISYNKKIERIGFYNKKIA